MSWSAEWEGPVGVASRGRLLISAGLRKARYYSGTNEGTGWLELSSWSFGVGSEASVRLEAERRIEDFRVGK